MTSNLSAFAFAVLVLGLFFSFEILPGGSSFVGASMLVIGGTNPDLPTDHASAAGALRPGAYNQSQ